MADPENTLPSITYWLMGSLSNVMMSDLTYVHNDKDDTRRLHVCRHCRAAFPTIFVADAEQFDPDIDGIAVSGLAEWYEAHCDDPENQI